MNKFIKKLIKIILSKKSYLGIIEKQINKEYDEKMNDPNNNEDKRSLEHERYYEVQFIEEEREKMYTDKILKKADKLKIPIPKRYDNNENLTDYWEEGPSRIQYLSRYGIKKLKNDIRKEKEWKLKKKEHFIKWITVLTGLIGTLIGLISVI